MPYGRDISIRGSMTVPFLRAFAPFQRVEGALFIFPNPNLQEGIMKRGNLKMPIHSLQGVVISMPIRMLHIPPPRVNMGQRGGRRHGTTGAEVSTRFPTSFPE
jgi:hypothetical protein